MRRIGNTCLLTLWLAAWAVADVAHRLHHAPVEPSACGSASCAHEPDETGRPAGPAHDARHCGLCRFLLMPAMATPAAPAVAALPCSDEAPIACPTLRIAADTFPRLPPVRGPPAHS